MRIVKHVLPFLPCIQVLQLVSAHQENDGNLRSQFFPDRTQGIYRIGSAVTPDFLLIDTNGGFLCIECTAHHRHAVCTACLQTMFLPRVTGRDDA